MERLESIIEQFNDKVNGFVCLWLARNHKGAMQSQALHLLQCF